MEQEQIKEGSSTEMIIEGSYNTEMASELNPITDASYEDMRKYLEGRKCSSFLYTGFLSTLTSANIYICLKDLASYDKPEKMANSENYVRVDDGVKEQIMQALSARNPGENIIGLYGLHTKVSVYVKTAIRRAHRDQLFQKIVMTNVTNKPHIRKIQSEVGAAIGLRFDDDEPDPGCLVFLAKNKRMSTAERASLFCAKMKEQETVLVILCALHGSLDLGKVGIPLATDHKGCKILLAS